MWGLGRLGLVGDQAKIDEIAARQYGVFNTSQFRSAGYDKSAVLRRVQSRRWVRLDHGVYSVASAPPKWERFLTAAILSRPGAIATGDPAAYLLGLRGFRRDRPVIYVRRGDNPRSEIARVIQTDLLDQIAITRVAGFAVTTVPETLLVLARNLSRPRLEAVFDDALLTGKLSLQSLDLIIERETGRRTPGLVNLRQLASERSSDAPSKGSSYLEAMLEMILSRSSLPNWVREHPFTLRSHTARVDAFIPEWKLVVEVDGRSWHARTGDFESDRRRDNELATHGVQVLRFTYHMLKSDPDKCLLTILETGRVRVAQGRV